MVIKVIVLGQTFKLVSTHTQKQQKNYLLISILPNLESEKRCEYLYQSPLERMYLPED